MLRVTVAEGLPALADVLAAELAVPLADPFTPDVVAVPGDGVRAWLVERLARRTGATSAGGDGVVANVDFTFPAGLVRRALGEPDEGRWSVGPLTWGIHAVMHAHGAELGLAPDAERARAIADLFDRYALHRPTMVRAWERGLDVDAWLAPLPEHHRWQPALWRHVRDLLGGPSDAQELALRTVELRAGRLVPDLPGRAFLVGLTSMPPPHLDVLSALAARIDLHLLVPQVSLAVWDRLAAMVATEQLAVSGPIVRDDAHTVGLVAHPLHRRWGRAPTEAAVRLAALAADGRRVEVIPAGTADPTSELAHLQRALRADEPAPVPIDRRGDGSVVWHRCHGLAREVEVLRDALLHLFDEAATRGAPIAPDEVAVLCADVAEAAPLVTAVFAGGRSVPPIPVHVADRSLRGSAPLVEAAGALLDLLDGRFRAGEVLAFAQRPPVRERFGLGADDLTLLAEWVERTEVRRGLDVDALADFGVPGAVPTNTWRAGLDQLAAGIAVGDRSASPYGPGGVALLTGLDDDAVALFGALAELLRRLDAAIVSLRGDHTMAAWCERLRAALGSLCAVPDAEAAQWRTIDTTLDALIAETQVVEAAHASPHAELAALVRARLRSPAGRSRFGTGAVTVSSLTALRGVPFRVVCLLGLDGDLTSPPAVSLDDLTGLTPCLGDADPRAEVRAQLLDAVASAGERLIVVTNGFDVRTNAAVPPATVVSELLEALGWDSDPPASAVVAHPRHAWSDASFGPLPGSGAQPWSFDRGALDGALARRGGATGATATVLAARERREVSVADLVGAVEQPCRAYLRGRLGVSIPEAPEPVDDLVPLGLTALGRSARVRELLELARGAPDGLTADAVDAWAEVHRRRGTLPPLRPGDEVVADASGSASAILAAYHAAAGRPYRAHEVLDLELSVGGRRVMGSIEGIDGLAEPGPLIVADVGASRLGSKHRLRAWIRLALVALALPDRRDDLVAVTVGRAASGDKAAAIALVLAPGVDPLEIVECALEVADAADRARVPLFGDTSLVLHRDGPEPAAEEWEGMFGDLGNRWSAFAYDGVAFDGLLAESPTELESSPAFGTGASRVERWAHRVWTCVDATVLERVAP